MPSRPRCETVVSEGMTGIPDEKRFDAWNPGIRSEVPKELLPLATLFRADNVFTSVPAALELQGLTGLPLAELVIFRPHRLALHELLLRVTADFEVPDGSRIGDLGINFRAIVNRLLTRHLLSRESIFRDAYAKARRELVDAVESAFRRVVVGTRRDWGPTEMASLDRMAVCTTVRAEAVAARTLSAVMSALFRTHGCAWGASALVVSLATDIACNEYGSEAIGQALEPLLQAAAEQEGYRLLPPQRRPVVINTKGASASGKSTLRPLQKALAVDIGVEWRDFALISPDIWRKQLLDYSSLGQHYKYAGAFTALELRIVDQKLDRYMALKHERGGTSHLLIDRFRFDSFAPDSEEAGSNLLTRFGQTVYLFLVVTPPDLLVERAWQRGLEFGRYKAVDDTLAHCVEAHNGIPDMFFTWTRRADKQLRFEFLDNSVGFGERPRTVAFGDNDTFNLLSARSLSNIQRYSRINVDALGPDQLFPDPGALAPDRNTTFLRRCVKQFRTISFAEQSTGKMYLRIEAGAVVWIDRDALDAAVKDADTLAGIREVAPAALGDSVRETQAPQFLQTRELAQTLGEWGRSTSDR
jgi:hypothetical protein